MSTRLALVPPASDEIIPADRRGTPARQHLGRLTKTEEARYRRLLDAGLSPARARFAAKRIKLDLMAG